MVQLVDDTEGGIRYWPRFVDVDTAQAWFECLRTNAAWSSMQRSMYDRIVDVPRLLSSYALHALPTNLPLADMLSRVQTFAPASYTHVGMNLYRDGRDSVFAKASSSRFLARLRATAKCSAEHELEAPTVQISAHKNAIHPRFCG